MGILGLGVIIGTVIILVKFLAVIFPFVVLASAVVDTDKEVK